MRSEPLDLPDDERLYRRIAPGRVVPEEDRPESSAFQLRRGEAGLSCYIASQCTPEQVLADHENFGLVALRVGDVMALGLTIIAAPVPEDPMLGHAHVEICPADTDQRKLQKAITRELARLAGASWIHHPVEQAQ